MATIRVLHAAGAFYPAVYWGGPTFSVYELCNGLARTQNAEVRVLTTDSSGPATTDRLTEAQKTPSQYPGYIVHFCRKIYGVDFAPSLWTDVWALVRWADLVHLTSVYTSTTMPVLVAARLLRKPLVWSPRGALQRWSGSRRGRVKHAWEMMCRALIRPGDTVLHVTSEDEGKASSARMGGLRYVVVPNGVVIPDRTGPRRYAKDGRAMRLLYIGRLDPKKGIENLIQTLARLPSSDYCLRICGIGEPAYSESLRALVLQLRLESRVAFLGQVDGVEKSAAYFDADVCVVPSFTENFGLVVAESLAHRTPVIASTGTPWQDIESRGVGRWVPNDPDSLAAAIVSMRNMDLPAMGQRGQEWMAAEFSWDRISVRMADIYRQLLSGRIERDSS